MPLRKVDIPVWSCGTRHKKGDCRARVCLSISSIPFSYFEGDRGHAYRIIRTVKTASARRRDRDIRCGLPDFWRWEPFRLFLSKGPLAFGSTVVASIEGTRPLMVEIQSLVTPDSFGMPRRTDHRRRLQQGHLLLRCSKKGGLHLGGMDVFVNVVGGLKLVDRPSTSDYYNGASQLKDIPIEAKNFRIRRSRPSVRYGP